MSTEMKKIPTSSNKVKVPQTRNITLSDGTIIKANDNQKKDIKKGLAKKHVIPKKKFSTETGKTNEEWEVVDDLDKSEYPPPSTHPLFRKFWSESIGNVTERSNFQAAHLGLLEALCRLRVELRALDNFVMENGHTYRLITVMGEQRKTYPEINERMKVLGQIGNFSRLLDLVPKKDTSKTLKKAEEEDKWD